MELIVVVVVVVVGGESVFFFLLEGFVFLWIVVFGVMIDFFLIVFWIDNLGWLFFWGWKEGWGGVCELSLWYLIWLCCGVVVFWGCFLKCEVVLFDVVIVDYFVVNWRFVGVVLGVFWFLWCLFEGLVCV